MYIQGLRSVFFAAFLAATLFGQCTYKIAPTNTSFTVSGGLGAALLTVTGTNCAWTVFSPDAGTWISFPSGQAGTGSQLVQYRIAPNVGQARTGTISVGGQSFKVTQNTSVQRFNDVPPSSAFFNYISLMAENQITGGCWVNPPLYCPSSVHTRGQMAVFITLAYYKAKGGSVPDPPTTPTFADVPVNHGFYKFIEEIYRLGITAGCATNPLRYCPDTEIPHEQMAAFMIRTWRLVTGDTTLHSTTPYFTDVPSSSQFFPAIQKMRDLGFWTGCGNGQYCPSSIVTREQASQLIMCSILSAAPPPLQVTVTTSPPGLLVTVDGYTSSPSPVNVLWTPGTSHTLGAPPQADANGTWWAFSSWSDSVPGGSRAVNVPFVTSYSATFVITSGAKPSIAGSSYLHTNLAFIPFSKYNDPSDSWFSRSCPPNTTVRQCFQTILGELRSQRVSGVRVFVKICGADSRAFDCESQLTWQQHSWSPNPSGASQIQRDQYTWITNVDSFFADVKASGIQNVAITLVHAEPPRWSVPSSDARTNPPGSFGHCAGTPATLHFNATEPYALVPTSKPSEYFPVGERDNNAYNCGATNPFFIGWNNQLNMIDALLAKAQARGVTVSQLEPEQEINLRDFTVQLRHIYDNAYPESAGQAADTTAEVYTKLRDLMFNHSFARDNVAYSAGASESSVSNFDCVNVYTDYARQEGLDAIAAAIGGGFIGRGPETPQNGLWCGQGSIGTMFRSPIYGAQPRIVDLHVYPRIPSTPNTEANVRDVANRVFDSLDHFFAVVPILNPIVMIGETHRTIEYREVPGCPWADFERIPDEAAAALVQGFNTSLLAGRTVVFRPWMQLADPSGICFPRGLYQKVNFVPGGPYSPAFW